jgi:hypothetical protein
MPRVSKINPFLPTLYDVSKWNVCHNENADRNYPRGVTRIYDFYMRPRIMFLNSILITEQVTWLNDTVQSCNFQTNPLSILTWCKVGRRVYRFHDFNSLTPLYISSVIWLSRLVMNKKIWQFISKCDLNRNSRRIPEAKSMSQFSGVQQ